MRIPSRPSTPPYSSRPNTPNHLSPYSPTSPHHSPSRYPTGHRRRASDERNLTLIKLDKIQANLNQKDGEGREFKHSSFRQFLDIVHSVLTGLGMDISHIWYEPHNLRYLEKDFIKPATELFKLENFPARGNPLAEFTQSFHRSKVKGNEAGIKILDKIFECAKQLLEIKSEIDATEDTKEDSTVQNDTALKKAIEIKQKVIKAISKLNIKNTEVIARLLLQKLAHICINDIDCDIFTNDNSLQLRLLLRLGVNPNHRVETFEDRPCLIHLVVGQNSLQNNSSDNSSSYSSNSDNRSDSSASDDTIPHAVDCLELLKQKGANLHEMDGDGNTLLSLASVQYDDDNFLKSCLGEYEQILNINRKDKDRKTPLYRAIEAEMMDNVWTLFEAGASVTDIGRDKKGKPISADKLFQETISKTTASDALRNTLQDIKDVLSNENFKRTPLGQALKRQDTDYFSALLQENKTLDELEIDSEDHDANAIRYAILRQFHLQQTHQTSSNVIEQVCIPIGQNEEPLMDTESFLDLVKIYTNHITENDRTRTPREGSVTPPAKTPEPNA